MDKLLLTLIWLFCYLLQIEDMAGHAKKIRRKFVADYQHHPVLPTRRRWPPGFEEVPVIPCGASCIATFIYDLLAEKSLRWPFASSTALWTLHEGLTRHRWWFNGKNRPDCCIMCGECEPIELAKNQILDQNGNFLIFSRISLATQRIWRTNLIGSANVC